MTYCSTIAKPLLKKIKEKKTLDEIGEELCGKSIKNPKQKAIRLIKELLGEEILIQHAITLKYDIEKAELSRKRKAAPQRKINAPTYSDSSGSTEDKVPRENTCSEAGSEPQSEAEELAGELRRLVDRFGFDAVMAIVADIQQEIQEGIGG